MFPASMLFYLIRSKFRNIEYVSHVSAACHQHTRKCTELKHPPSSLREGQGDALPVEPMALNQEDAIVQGNADRDLCGPFLYLRDCSLLSTHAMQPSHSPNIMSPLMCCPPGQTGYQGSSMKGNQVVPLLMPLKNSYLRLARSGTKNEVGASPAVFHLSPFLRKRRNSISTPIPSNRIGIEYQDYRQIKKRHLGVSTYIQTGWPLEIMSGKSKRLTGKWQNFIIPIKVAMVRDLRR